MNLIGGNPSLVNHLQSVLGEEYIDYLSCFEVVPPVSVRLNKNKSVFKFRTGNHVPWCDNAFYLNERPSFIDDPLYHAGAYYPQEASSMFLDYILKQLNQKFTFKKVLDLCAAPGGKTLILADNFSNDTLIVANEINQKRVSILKENVTRWGCSNVLITNNDPQNFTEAKLQFDLIVVDAPCSGEGMFRKDPDTIREWSPGIVALCSARQQRILADINSCLAPGGILIYSTCTFNNAENEEIIKWLKNKFGFVNLNIPVPDKWRVQPSKNPEVEAFRFYPHKIGGEGFFLSVVQKPVVEDSNSEDGNFWGGQKSFKMKDLNKLKKIIDIQENQILLTFKGSLYLLEKSLLAFIREIINRLRVIHIPNEIGTIKGKDFVPAHALALNPNLKVNFETIEIDAVSAIKFLRKENFVNQNLNSGWYKLTYNGLGLGWIKVISKTRVNNYLPESYRIKKQASESVDV